MLVNLNFGSPEDRVLAVAKFHHAIHLHDFRGGYCPRGAILSRQLLEETLVDYTRFYSDQFDREHGYWPRVFGNLSDFGSVFWRYDMTVPSTYGPISLVGRSAFWRGRSDPRFTRYSVASEQTPGEAYLDDHVDPAWYDQNSLRPEFRSVEVSFGELEIPFSDLAYLLVEPLVFRGRHLIEHVRSALETNERSAWFLVGARLKERARPPWVTPEVWAGRLERMGHLVEWAADLEPTETVPLTVLSASVPDALSEWWDGLSAELQPRLGIWLWYIWSGTLRAMVGGP